MFENIQRNKTICQVGMLNKKDEDVTKLRDAVARLEAKLSKRDAEVKGTNWNQL